LPFVIKVSCSVFYPLVLFVKIKISYQPEAGTSVFSSPEILVG
jgi:hypothetical protein